MNNPTAEDLVKAKRFGYWTLRKDAEFYLNKRMDDQLKKPAVVVKAGTVVEVKKIYKNGQAILLHYADRTGKSWWSWKHAEC